MEWNKTQLKCKDPSRRIIVHPGLGIGKSESSDENLHRFLVYDFSRAFHKQGEMSTELETEQTGDSMSSYFWELSTSSWEIQVRVVYPKLEGLVSLNSQAVYALSSG